MISNFLFGSAENGAVACAQIYRKPSLRKNVEMSRLAETRGMGFLHKGVAGAGRPPFLLERRRDAAAWLYFRPH